MKHFDFLPYNKIEDVKSKPSTRRQSPPELHNSIDDEGLAGVPHVEQPPQQQNPRPDVIKC